MKKMISIMAIIAIIICLMIQPVKAASFNFIPTPSTTTAQNGDTIKINLNLTDIDAGEVGINTFECMLSYESEVFENITIDSKNNWSITYNASTGKILAVLVATGVTTNQEIGSITLNVRKDTSAKTGSINFTEVSSNDGKNIIPTANKTVTIKVLGNETTNPIEETNTNIGSGSGSSSTTSKPTTSTTNKKSENLSSKAIPKAGDKLYAVAICVIIMAGISIWSFIKFLKYNKK